MAKRPAKPKLGRLEKLDPTDYWQTQADFQQWLTEVESLELLAEATGLVLGEVEGVGPGYSLMRTADTGAPVLVVATLGTATAAALGQMVSWAATEVATAVIWAAPAFDDDTAAALAWLNQISQGLFCGLSVELWHIGQTAMAVNFVPVSGDGAGADPEVADPEGADPGVTDPGVTDPEGADPEGADPEITADSKGGGLEGPVPEPLSEQQQENLAFWSGLCDRMDRQGSLVKPGSPATAATMGFAIARAGFRLNAIVDRDHQSLYTELLLSGIDARPHFYLLATEREQIADEVGLPLIWDDSGEHSCVIASTLAEADLSDRDRWPTYYAWFCDCLERFYEVFFDRIKRLDATAYQPPRRARPLVDALVLPAGQNR